MMPPDDVTEPVTGSVPGADPLDLFVRYTKGDVSAEERARVEMAMARDAEVATHVVATRAALWDGNAQLERAWATIDAPQRAIGTANARRAPAARTKDLRIARWTGAWGWISGVAAVLAIAMLLRPNATNSVSNSGVTRTYATGPQQQAHITLNDGTRVTLAENTTVQLDNFGARSRTVSLTGEAYFEVPHATGAPFVVRSGTATTRVLGTAFLVRHADARAATHVIVEQGKVSLSAGATSPTVTIAAGNAGATSDSTVRLSSSDDPDHQASWMNGKLFFRNAALTDVFATLRQWYGYEFRVADASLMQRRVTLGLTTHSSAAAFSNLEQVLDVNITVVGDTVTLAPRRTPRPSAMPRTRSYEMGTATKEVGR